MNTQEKVKALSIYLPNDLAMRIKEQAIRDKRSMSAEVVVIIERGWID